MSVLIKPRWNIKMRRLKQRKKIDEKIINSCNLDRHSNAERSACIIPLKLPHWGRGSPNRIERFTACSGTLRPIGRRHATGGHQRHADCGLCSAEKMIKHARFIRGECTNIRVTTAGSVVLRAHWVDHVREALPVSDYRLIHSAVLLVLHIRDLHSCWLSFHSGLCFYSKGNVFLAKAPLVCQCLAPYRTVSTMDVSYHLAQTHCTALICKKFINSGLVPQTARK